MILVSAPATNSEYLQYHDSIITAHNWRFIKITVNALWFHLDIRSQYRLKVSKRDLYRDPEL